MHEGRNGKQLMVTLQSDIRLFDGECLFSRYVLQGSRWRVSDLTYRVTKYPTTTRLKKSEVREESNKIMEKDKLKFYR